MSDTPTADTATSLKPLSFRKALPVVFLITGVFFFNFIARLLPGPFLPEMEAEFGVGHATAGSLFLFISLGFCPALLFSGFVSERIGHRRTILLSAVGVGLSLILTGLAGDFSDLCAAMLFLGCTAGLYLPSGVAALTTTAPKRHWGKALSIHELAPNFSFMLAPALASIPAAAIGWRTAFIGVGVAATAMAAAYCFFGPVVNERGRAPRPAVLKEAFAKPQLWLLCVFFSMGIGAGLGSFTMLPTFLHEVKGMALEDANMLLASSRIAGPPMALASGFIVDRIGPQSAIALSLGLTGALTASFGVLDGYLLYTAVLLQPPIGVLFFPAGFTAASNEFDSDLRSTAVAIIITTALLFASGVLPPVLGLFGDHRMFEAGFLCLGLFVAFGALLSIRFKL